MCSLAELGWSEFFASQLAQVETAGAVAARVAGESRGLYRVLCTEGDFLAGLSGKFRHDVGRRADFPAVGDWVLATIRASEGRATIHRVLPRRSRFSRKVAGARTEEQIVAANVDVVFLVSSLNREFNPRRMERYLSLAWESGATPVIVLNKCDLCENVQAFRTESGEFAIGVRVVLTSATCGDGIDELRSILRGKEQSCVTAALLGSSGVGKSSLINALFGGERLARQAVREDDDRGRHTTTSRQMVLLPQGGVLIDTPGMRELQLWDAADGIGRAFGDIQELAAGCKFRDCRHLSESGCAVRAAVEAKALACERLENFRKLEKEERFLESKQNAAVWSQRTRELRRMMKSVNRFYRDRGR